MLVVGCPALPPALELSVPSSASNLDLDGVRVTVSVTDSTGNPATGSVTLTTTIGTLGAATLQLAEGTASTTLRCLIGMDGTCVGSGEVKGQWAQGGQTANATATIRFSTPTVFDAGPRVDAGTSDGGRDGGNSDGGSSDGGVLDGGLSGTSFAGMGRILVFGRTGIRYGVSSFADNSMTAFGWQQTPVTPRLFGDSIAYVRDGGVYLVISDSLNARDAGIDAGTVYTFPDTPESNDVALPTGCGQLEVTELVSGNGTLWARCSDDRLASLSRPGFFVDLNGAGTPLAVSGEIVLVTNDGGLFVRSASDRIPVMTSSGRRFGAFRPNDGVFPGFIGVSFSPAQSQCFRAEVSGSGTLTERPALEFSFPDGGSSPNCLAAVPVPDRPGFLIRGAFADGGATVFDDGGSGFIELLPVTVDAGSDGGLDGGEDSDGGMDGGVGGGPFSGPPRRFVFGPTTDLSLRPPTIFVSGDESQLIVGY
jgi:hypothetical protein